MLHGVISKESELIQPKALQTNMAHKTNRNSKNKYLHSHRQENSQKDRQIKDILIISQTCTETVTHGLRLRQIQIQMDTQLNT